MAARFCSNLIALDNRQMATPVDYSMHVPPEIWLHVFREDNLPRKYLKETSLACRTFNEAAQHHLRKHVRIPADVHPFTKEYKEGLETITSNLIAGSVISLTIAYSNVYNELMTFWQLAENSQSTSTGDARDVVFGVSLPPPKPREHPQLFSTLRAFSNITTITAFAMELTVQHTSILSELKNLRHLHLEDCITSSRMLYFTSENVPAIPPLQLKSLAIIRGDLLGAADTSRAVWEPLLSPGTIESLSLRGDASTRALEILTAHSLPALRTLQLPKKTFVWDGLQDFMAACDELQELHFIEPGGLSFNKDLQPVTMASIEAPFRAASFPKLTSYSGPMRYCVSFCYARPVRVFRLTTVLRDSMTINTLLPQLADACPALEELYLNVENARNKLPSSLDYFSSLKVCVVKYLKMTVDDMEKICKKLSEAFLPGKLEKLHLEVDPVYYGTGRMQSEVMMDAEKWCTNQIEQLTLFHPSLRDLRVVGTMSTANGTGNQ